MKRKLNYELIKELYLLDNSCEKIAKQLNYTISGVYYAIHSMNLSRKYKLCENQELILSNIQEEVLMGTILGDAHINLQRKNAWVKFEQGNNQYDLIKWKHNIFSNMSSPIKLNIRQPDKRTGNIYKSYSFYLKSNPALNIFYNKFYQDHIKIIPFSILNKYTELSLATHIMDDGSRNGNSIILNMQCFQTNEVENFGVFLNDKFNIKCKLRFNREKPILTINSTSLNLVKFLTDKYIIESMKYKVS